jgi:hypothetical protein
MIRTVSAFVIGSAAGALALAAFLASSTVYWRSTLFPGRMIRVTWGYGTLAMTSQRDGLAPAYRLPAARQVQP